MRVYLCVQNLFDAEDHGLDETEQKHACVDNFTQHSSTEDLLPYISMS